MEMTSVLLALKVDSIFIHATMVIMLLLGALITWTLIEMSEAQRVPRQKVVIKMKNKK